MLVSELKELLGTKPQDNPIMLCDTSINAINMDGLYSINIDSVQSNHVLINGYKVNLTIIIFNKERTSK